MEKLSASLRRYYPDQVKRVSHNALSATKGLPQLIVIYHLSRLKSIYNEMITGFSISTGEMQSPWNSSPP